MMQIEVLFTPAEFNALGARDLSRTTAVVFDILRATTTMITALVNGATSVTPAATIEEALAKRSANPMALLAGERDGVRIRAALTGGVDFDLGNSPREFTREVVNGRDIIMSTTNGTRALRAGACARMVFPAAFANLTATAEAVVAAQPERILLICSGTYEDAAFEDTLAAGAMVEELAARLPGVKLLDSASIAHEVWRVLRRDLRGAMRHSRNGTRLLGVPELAEDVSVCLMRDSTSLVAAQSAAGVITAVTRGA